MVKALFWYFSALCIMNVGLFSVCADTAAIAAESQDLLRVRVLQKYQSETVMVYDLENKTRILTIDRSTPFPQRFHFEKGFRISMPRQKIERDYSGQLLLERQGEELLLINVVQLEDYVTSVVLSEMGWQAKEALRAQAIVARTRAIKHRKPAALYDFADLTSEQVYKGLFSQTHKTKQILQPTFGKVLKYQGQLAQVYYYGKCGERMYSKREIWGGEEIAYLKTKPLPYLLSSAEISTWQCKLSYQAVNALFQQEDSMGYINHKYSMNSKRGVLGVDVGGKWLAIDDFRIKINRKLGWNKLKSNSFEFDLKNGYFHFKGSGFGHLVGMCQQGSVSMAKMGLSYHDILQYFYPGTLVRLYDSQ